jgi:serine/threonine protein kinase
MMPGGTVAGKYRILRPLGQGGMARVVVARHIALDTEVAIKLLKSDLREDEDMRARFFREAQAAARLRNPHVVQVQDVGETEAGTPYIVMEYLQGRDLASLLKEKGRLELAAACQILLQCCEGLAVAHAAGIIHRDIKPANLFLAETHGGTVTKMLDFGISKFVGAVDARSVELTGTQQAIGSPSYMSPEQMRAIREIDERTDIWALGVVLYRMLTGRLPFTADSLADLHLLVLSGRLTPPRDHLPSLPQELDRLICGCLSVEPWRRPRTVAEVARALAPFAPPEAAAQADRVERIVRERRPPTEHASAVVPRAVATEGDETALVAPNPVRSEDPAAPKQTSEQVEGSPASAEPTPHVIESQAVGPRRRRRAAFVPFVVFGVVVGALWLWGSSVSSGARPASDAADRSAPTLQDLSTSELKRSAPEMAAAARDTSREGSADPVREAASTAASTEPAAGLLVAPPANTTGGAAEDHASAQPARPRASTAPRADRTHPSSTGRSVGSSAPQPATKPPAAPETSSDDPFDRRH